jgi:hypothetical protein
MRMCRDWTPNGHILQYEVLSVAYFAIVLIRTTVDRREKCIEVGTVKF